MNWTMWARYFSHYVAILDFIHALQYVFAAAMAGRSFDEGWAIYCRWIQAIWAGRVDDVLGELRARQEEIGLPPPKASATDPRQTVATTIGYLATHRGRMDYPRYRCLGLPIMSSYVESAVKQIGRRVKATEKFWCEAGAEAILQLRADYLSDTAPLERFMTRRTESATGHRTYRRNPRPPANTVPPNAKRVVRPGTRAHHALCGLDQFWYPTTSDYWNPVNGSFPGSIGHSLSKGAKDGEEASIASSRAGHGQAGSREYCGCGQLNGQLNGIMPRSLEKEDNEHEVS